MTDHHTIDVAAHVRTYLIVFASLLVLTAVTVAVAYLHLAPAAAVAVALLIASIKGSLVACYFMHLISEKKLIYSLLVLTVIFFFVLLLLPMLADADQVRSRTS